MGLSSVGVTARRPVQPITPKQSAEKSASGNVNAAGSGASPAGASSLQFRSMSLGDVLSRQQPASYTMQGVADPISQPFVSSFTAVAADPQAFNDLLESVFGDNIDRGQAEQFRQSALQGDSSFLPRVEYVEASVLHGGNGAYSAETNTIYINQDLKGTELGTQTFVEEAGHFLDARPNTSDTRGDEGELFRRVLSGESLSVDAVAAIRAEDDSGTIKVDGNQIEVEFWSLGGHGQ